MTFSRQPEDVTSFMDVLRKICTLLLVISYYFHSTNFHLSPNDFKNQIYDLKSIEKRFIDVAKTIFTNYLIRAIILTPN